MKKLFYGLAMCLIFLMIFGSCRGPQTSTIEGVVVNKYFTNEENSYVDIQAKLASYYMEPSGSKSVNLIRLIFDTDNITESAWGYNFKRKAELLNEIISIGDVIKVEVLEHKHFVKHVLFILEIRKSVND